MTCITEKLNHVAAAVSVEYFDYSFMLPQAKAKTMKEI